MDKLELLLEAIENLYQRQIEVSKTHPEQINLVMASMVNGVYSLSKEVIGEANKTTVALTKTPAFLHPLYQPTFSKAKLPNYLRVIK